MSFLKKLFNNQTDEKVHIQFSRFSKGTFENRAILEITVTGNKVKIKASAEFVNEFVELMANTIEEKTHIKGIIFSTRNLSEESDIKFEDIKSAMGVKKHIVNSELSKDQILELCEKFPNASINLSFKTEFGELKIKEKAPKSGKSGKKENENPKPDYCALITNDKSILEDYAFDIKESFKKASISHTYIIENIEIPDKYKDNFELARLYAIRKGKIIRKLNIDGKESQKEIDFKA